MLLEFSENGIYCPQADVYIDPWRPVNKAIITHAHSDHAKYGHKYYLAHQQSEGILKHRLGQNISIQTVSYSEPIHINGVHISLHPAGHIQGSSQIRLEYKGEIWVVSGDYKLNNDRINTPFEAIYCHHFITESTFGLPVYRFPQIDHIEKELHTWLQQNINNGYNSVLLGYSLGKAQQILSIIPQEVPVILHRSVFNANEALGLSNNRYQVFSDSMKKGVIKNSIIIAPPSVLGNPWLKRFEPYKTAFFSGWMSIRGAKKRKNVDMGFVLSDHADWNGLQDAIISTKAENIYITHGYKSVLSRWIKEKLLLNAMELDTLFTGESLDLPEAEI